MINSNYMSDNTNSTPENNNKENPFEQMYGSSSNSTTNSPSMYDNPYPSIQKDDLQKNNLNDPLQNQVQEEPQNIDAFANDVNAMFQTKEKTVEQEKLLDTKNKQKKEEKLTLHLDKKNPFTETPTVQKNTTDSFTVVLALICLGFFLLVQNFAQACKRYCQTDSSLSNSIISGASLAYLLSKGLPFLLHLVHATSPQVTNLYLGKEGHLLLISLMAFGLGFALNYFFEKKTARNTIEDVKHSLTLYRSNLTALTVVFFFAGLTLINMTYMQTVDILQYGLFIGLLLCMETATLCHIFINRNDFVRRLVLSASVIGGFVVGKVAGALILPATFSMGFGFILGFFVFTTMRIELATIKRNSNYPAFIISFIGVFALTLIQSLYESVKC